MRDIRLAVIKGQKELRRLDPELGRLIASQGTILHQPRSDYFVSLVRSIVGQQISVKAAASIFGRLQEHTGLEPAKVVALDQPSAKQIGLSASKLRYIKDLAQHFVRDSAVFNHLENLNDDAVIAELTKVKGIGVWTAQMFLMFTLGRLDVFAPDDVGLQRAMMRLYGWDSLPARAELVRHAERWSPYRTIAAWHLWHMLDNEPA
jgi:DNA-3-methyladenine glycosylase II